jgi:4'-phosphopantetheinyl transferase
MMALAETGSAPDVKHGSDSGWLVDLRVAPLAEAAALLRRLGHVVCLLDVTIDQARLPVPLASEITSSALPHHPEGYRLRRRVARAIAADYLGTGAETLAIETTPDGAPFLPLAPALRLSFAARGDVALVALATRPLGVDLEAPIAPEAVPWNILATAEREALLQHPPENRAEHFQFLWSAKEALVKALGTGFATPPEKVAIIPNFDHEYSEIDYFYAHKFNNSTYLIRQKQLNHPKDFAISLALLSDDAQ